MFSNPIGILFSQAVMEAFHFAEENLLLCSYNDNREGKNKKQIKSK
jgi:hypothetical protein